MVKIDFYWNESCNVLSNEDTTAKSNNFINKHDVFLSVIKYLKDNKTMKQQMHSLWSFIYV